VVPSVAALVFIGAAAAAGIYVGTKPTVIDGDVMEADLVRQHGDKGIVRMTCDDKIPITREGATFECQAFGNDGSTALIRYRMNRAGGLSGDVVDATRPRPPAGQDSWSN
jgi:hypothetical protein